MPREYALRLDKYGIDNKMFQELKWHCLQYPAKVEELRDLRVGFHSFAPKETPGGGETGDPTAQSAMRAAKLEEELAVIVQAAIGASAELYPFILDNVTRGVRFGLLRAPCGKNQFSAARARFYVNLAVAMGKIGEFGVTDL